MPILKGTATFSRYRVEHEGKDAKRALKDLAKALQLRAFQPLERDGKDERSQGFVELEHKDQTEFSTGALYEGDFALFTYRVDEVRVPSAALRASLEAWAQAFEVENKRAPGRKEKSDAKEELKHTLKSRYPVTTKTFDVSWNVETEHAQIWAGSRKAVDEVQAAVEQAFSVKLIPVAPVTIAPQLGIPEKALAPTPAFSNAEEN